MAKVLEETPREDRLVILGDFNARVGTKDDAWNQELGPHGIPERNDNGERVLQLCARFGLKVTNTCFKHREYGTWQHMRFKTWHMIDLVIVRARDMRWIRDTRVMCDAECDTDHRLVTTRIDTRNFHSGTARDTNDATVSKRPARMNVGKLKEPDTERQLCDKVH